MIEIRIQVTDDGRLSFASNVEAHPCFYAGLLEQAKLAILLQPQAAPAPHTPGLLVPRGPLPIDLKRKD